MEITGITWLGPPPDDGGLLDELPRELRNVLAAANGFILSGGALHVRGAVRAPEWHSLRAAWRGPRGFAALYPAVQADDVPFAQDCVGDQFLLRAGEVVRLLAETSDVEPMGVGLMEFLERACTDPPEFLAAQPLEQYWADGGVLEPGMLLHAYPPFCTAQARDGVSLRPVPAAELIRLHADFARQIASVPDGAPIRFAASDE